MGEVCQEAEVQYFVWIYLFSLTTQARMVSSSNPTGTVNDLELRLMLMHILLFAPRMAPLAHIHIYVDKTAAQGWENRVSVITASPVGPILR